MIRIVLFLVAIFECGCSPVTRPDLMVANETNAEITVTVRWRSGGVLVDNWIIGSQSDKKHIAFPGKILDEDAMVEVVSGSHKASHLVRPTRGISLNKKEILIIIRRDSVIISVP